MEERSSIWEVLELRSRKHPQKDAVIFLADGDTQEERCTFAGLYERALRCGAGLQTRGVRKGDRVMIVLPNGLDFLACFYGAMAVGAVAVPVYAPLARHRSEHYLETVAAILANSRARLMVTFPRARGLLSGLSRRADGLDEVVTFGQIHNRRGECLSPPFSSEDPALIQYTSGSTSLPRGVTISQRNLFANVRNIGEAWSAVAESEIVCSWLPAYHDMGLVGTILLSLCWGFTLCLLSPLHFLSNPLRWLQAISRYRCTFTTAPNFAYDLCARRAEGADLSRLDLSCWKVACNGAEPIRKSTLEAFSDRFASCGFDRRSIFPVYGLAEHTLAVSFPRSRREPRYLGVWRSSLQPGGTVEIGGSGAARVDCVSVGEPFPAHEIRVVDEHAHALPELAVGEIAVGGPSLSEGYYGLQGGFESELLPERGGGGPLFRTGDLGFFHQGELYVTGRKKDLVVVRGQNYYPQDIEAIVDECSNARRGCSGAFSVEGNDGTESLVVVAEIRDGREGARQRLQEEIASRVTNGLGVSVGEVVLLPARTIPKTSSGKIRRRKCRELFLAKELPAARALPLWRKAIRRTRSGVDRLFASARQGIRSHTRGGPEPLPSPDLGWGESSGAAWHLLCESIARVTGKHVDPHRLRADQTPEDLGLDSLARVDLLLEVERRLPGAVLEPELMEAGTLGELAVLIAKGVPSSGQEAATSLRELLLRRDPQPSLSRKADSVMREKLSFAVLRLFGLVSRVLWQHEVEGIDNLPPTGPLIFCPNHLSLLDAYWIVCRLPRKYVNVHVFGKKELREGVLTRVTGSIVGLIPVDRSGNFLPALRQGARALRKGEVLLVHPEGTRSHTGRLLPFKQGVALLASELGVPIVPIAVTGSFEVFPRGRRIPSLFAWANRNRHQVRVRIGKPLIPKDDAGSDRASAADLMERLRAEIEALLEESSV
ncbi:AMP-binding protein [Planctomycetota bacterium]